MRLSINEVRLKSILHFLFPTQSLLADSIDLFPFISIYFSNFHRAFNLRLDANAAIKAVRKGIMYDVRRRTWVVQRRRRTVSPPQLKQHNSKMKERTKKRKKRLFLRPSSPLPSIHLALACSLARVCIESSLSRVGTKREVGINWEGSLGRETNTPRHQARAGPFRKPVLDSPLDPPSFLSSAPGSRSILDELSSPNRLPSRRKTEITSGHTSNIHRVRANSFFFFLFFLQRELYNERHTIFTFWMPSEIRRAVRLIKACFVRGESVKRSHTSVNTTRQDAFSIRTRAGVRVLERVLQRDSIRPRSVNCAKKKKSSFYEQISRQLAIRSQPTTSKWVEFQARVYSHRLYWKGSLLRSN